MRINNYFKRKIITNNDTVNFDKCYSIKYNSNNKDSNTIMEIYLWSVLLGRNLLCARKIGLLSHITTYTKSLSTIL